MVWDEIVAFWLVLWLTPDSLLAQLLAFIIFRLFDIIKPPPIHFFDGHFKNGFGVMWDDILAAAYSLLVIAVLVRFEVLRSEEHTSVLQSLMRISYAVFCLKKKNKILYK